MAIPVKAEGSDLESRVDQYKDAFPIKLIGQEATDLAANCATAQSRLNDIFLRLSSTKTVYLAAYAMVDTRLSAIQKRLGKHQFDTSTIDLLLANYRRDVENYESAIDNYQSTLSDASLIKCTDDIDGFASALAAARQYRSDLEQAAIAINNYATINVDAAFTSIKNSLESK